MTIEKIAIEDLHNDKEAQYFFLCFPLNLKIFETDAIKVVM